MAVITAARLVPMGKPVGLVLGLGYFGIEQHSAALGGIEWQSAAFGGVGRHWAAFGYFFNQPLVGSDALQGPPLVWVPCGRLQPEEFIILRKWWLGALGAHEDCRLVWRTARSLW